MLNRFRSSGACPLRLRPVLPMASLAAFTLAAALVTGALVTVASSLVLPRPAAAQDDSRSNAESRPKGFKVLLDRVTHRGREVVGVYGQVSEPSQPGMWRVQVWEELDDRVTVATDKIGCSPTSPLRITGSARRLVIRELNPGGVITPANRLDHLMWWAVCVPEQAGKDPASLGPLARQLGYSGRLPEREQVVLGPGR
ncbi:hypothetical protein KBY82_08940 [Cyanobium sp. AMD-g]|uniref:hypothetical protein n=1 Tax=Cyanobium sp. AMD-g TaxID=2823699 RepID=UPI0020CEC371|nr:hypothetical protein [Cyanobium sp. AMD-g]MCP9930910.1 hypothetical protein [Cyanobium sp. AMD-g]